MPISVLQNDDGLWTVTAPSLVITGLTKEAADAFVASYHRLQDARAAAT